MPMAASPSSSAAMTISSGCDAPRRNETFVVTANSAYAVVGAVIGRYSRKQAVYEPARVRCFAAVDAFAVKPEPLAAGILDEVVIACRFMHAVAPPFAGDALRPFCAGDVVGFAAPEKLPRRSVGHQG